MLVDRLDGQHYFLQFRHRQMFRMAFKSPRKMIVSKQRTCSVLRLLGSVANMIGSLAAWSLPVVNSYSGVNKFQADDTRVCVCVRDIFIFYCSRILYKR